MFIVKKDGNIQKYDVEKIITAVQKSAHRVNYEFNDKEKKKIIDYVEQQLSWMNKKNIPVVTMHQLVETALDRVKPEVAKSYRDYRNFKNEYATMMGEVVEESNRIMFLGDKENSNTDSKLVSTKRTLTLNALNKELYKKFFLNEDEIQAIKDGYIYIHDMVARRDTMNCFARSTRFITDRGVRSFYDFKEGDVVRVLTHKGNWKPAAVHQYGWQKLYKLIFKRANGNVKEVYATRNHRWILKDGSETTNINVGDMLIAAPDETDFSWVLESIEPVAQHQEEQVWCLDVQDDHSFILEGGIPTGNCCLFRLGDVLKGGFEMSNMWYNEPKTIDTAFDVAGDVILMSASQQYGGFTVPQVDYIMEPYAIKSYEKYKKQYEEMGVCKDKIKEFAIESTKREIEQGYQGWEYKFNTVASSRGDYPFITVTFGLNTSFWGKTISKIILTTHANGQGKKGFEKATLFPKLVFLYDENIHGEGKESEDVFDAGIYCSSKTMYPDWLSMSGDGYISSMYKKYHKVVSPMGKCKISPCKTVLNH